YAVVGTFAPPRNETHNPRVDMSGDVCASGTESNSCERRSFPPIFAVGSGCASRKLVDSTSHRGAPSSLPRRGWTTQPGVAYSRTPGCVVQPLRGKRPGRATGGRALVTGTRRQPPTTKTLTRRLTWATPRTAPG